MGDKYKYLLKNIGLMTISNFASKILSFLLVPLYTSVLTTTEYGTYDLYITTCFLLTPLLSVCIAEAVLRFLLDKSRNSDSIFNVAVRFYIKACIIMLSLVLLNYWTGIIKVFNEYPLFLFLYFVLSLMSDIMTQFARGQERVADVAVAGILSSVLSVSLNVLLLLVFPMGIRGYFIANCLTFTITSLYLMIRTRIWKHFRFSGYKRELGDEMTGYSAPLIMNQIGWWINNVSDRYIVTWLCGVAANGIYSVAYKIPSILTMFQTIFNQAWTLSAIREFDKKNKDFYSNIYKLYNCGMTIVCSGIIIGNKLIARVLFANEFYSAWKYAPFLMISVVFGSLSALLGGIFSAAKESKIIARTTVAGASVNTVLNIVLVYFMGPVGAAIATLFSYIIVWGMRLRSANKFVKLNIGLKRDFFSYIILIFQSVILLMETVNLTYVMELFAFALIVLAYRRECVVVIRQFVKNHKRVRQQ